MNRSLSTEGRMIFTLFAGLLLQMSVANAQPQGYQAPNFAGMAGQKFHQAQQIPAFPASPLAGGPAAAQGGEFIDVQGKPIVVQTQYNEMYPQSFAPGGGYGDPMAVDFGGYGEEQVGPHYFDISADVVYLQANELFSGVGGFTSVGVGGPIVLDAEDSLQDYEPGFQITGRYDIGALSVIEATYMGLHDIGFSASINSLTATQAVFGVPQNFQLESIFSNFGENLAVFPVEGFDDASQHTINYESDLQSTEISYRRYWVGANPRVSGTLLAGARYLRMTEGFNFSGMGLSNNNLLVAGSRTYESENDMVGFQFGGDGWIGLRQGLRIGGEAKAGVYNNRFKFRHAATLPDAANDFDETISGNQVAFAAEGGASIVADILPSWSVRGGYRVLYLNSLATVGASVSRDIASTVVGSQGHALYHGFHGGVEYVW